LQSGGFAGKFAKWFGKGMELINPYNLGATVVSAGVLCPVTAE
jgi:hypothetical protein